MFGYVKAYKPELKCRDYDIYKGIYCSLCKRLARRYSPLSQLALSYDMAFFALTGMALSTDCHGFKKSRCMYNPFVRCMKCSDTQILDMTADISVIMMYHKLRDDLHDRGIGKKIAAAALYPWAALMRRKARKKMPEAEEIVADAMSRQAEVEKSEKPCVDAAADPSARALSRLFELLAHADEDKAALARAGYLAGRFAYLADAADDLESDMKHGNFNPFSERYLHADTDEKKLEFKKYVTDVLTLTAGEAAGAYEKLKINKFDDLLRNIFYDGLYNSMKEITGRYGHEEPV